jgi:hypothetical protein
MSKTFNFEIKNMNSHLLINLKGEITRNDACVFLKKVMEFSEECKIYKLLYNAKQAFITGSKYSQQFFALFDIELIENDNSYLIAILVKPEDSSHSFIIKALKDNNRNARLFIDENEAKKWLLEN